MTKQAKLTRYEARNLRMGVKCRKVRHTARVGDRFEIEVNGHRVIGRIRNFEKPCHGIISATWHVPELGIDVIRYLSETY